MADLPADARADAAPALVPDWLINLAALGWRVFVIVALLIALWGLASVLWTVTASIAVAVVIAAIFAPIVVRLRERGRSRTAAAAIVWVVRPRLVIAGVLLLLGIAFMPYVVDVLRQIQAGITALQAALAGLNLPPEVGTAVQRPRRRRARRLRRTSPAPSPRRVGERRSRSSILATFLVFFFLQDGDKAWVWIFQAASDQKRERDHRGRRRCPVARRWLPAGHDHPVRRSSRVTDFVFMFVLGVPLAVPLALLVFLSGYIPYFGGIVATGLILLVTYAALGSGPVIAMLVLIAIRNAILGYGVRPAVYGRTVSIHPARGPHRPARGVRAGRRRRPVRRRARDRDRPRRRERDGRDPRPRARAPSCRRSCRPGSTGWRNGAGGSSSRSASSRCSWAIFVAMPLVVIPVVLAVILAATLDPLVRWLDAPRPVARPGRGHRRGRRLPRGRGRAVAGGRVARQPGGDMSRRRLRGADTVNAPPAASSACSRGPSRRGGARRRQRRSPRLAAAVGQVAVIVILSTLLAFYFLRDGARLWDRVLGRVRADVAPGGQRGRRPRVRRPRRLHDRDRRRSRSSGPAASS